MELKSQFMNEVKQKRETWIVIRQLVEEGTPVTKDQFNFLLTEVERLFCDDLSNTYTPNFPLKMALIENISKAKEKYIELLRQFSTAEDKINVEKLSLVKSTSILKKQIETAKAIIKETNELTSVLHSFEEGETEFLSEWNEMRERLSIMRQKWTIGRTILPKEKGWLLSKALFSIHYQEVEGHLYFSSEMERKQEETEREELLHSFKRCLSIYESLFTEISSMKPKAVQFSFQYKKDAEKILSLLEEVNTKVSTEKAMQEVFTLDEE